MVRRPTAALETCCRYIENLGLPYHLQAVCVVHLFTGVLLLSGVFTQGATIGVLLLFVSFLGVFTLCRFAPPAVSSVAVSASLADVEKALPAMALAMSDMEKALPTMSLASHDTSSQLAEKQRQLVEVAAPAVVFDRDELPDMRPVGSRAQEVSVDVAEPSVVKDDSTRENCPAETPRGQRLEQAGSSVASGHNGLLIPSDSTVLEGLRMFLVHHLRRSEIESLSEAQAEMLEHHLVKLANYSQRIVHTISFAQRVLADSRLAEQEQAQAQTEPEAQWATASAEPQGPLESVPEKPRRRLKLTDGDLVRMYSLAQREAALEADWRGFGDSAMQAASSSSAPFGSVEAVLEPPGVSKWRVGDAQLEAPTHRTRERMAAIELLGHALQAQHSSSPGESSDDIARRLLPAQGSRVCEDNIIPKFGSCCALGSGEAEAPRVGIAKPLEHLGRVPVLRLGDFTANPPQADSTALTAPPPVVPKWLEPEDDSKVTADMPEGRVSEPGAQPEWHDGLWQVP